MLDQLIQAKEEGRLEGQIELLDEILNLVFKGDVQLNEIIQHSRHINNLEMVETLRELVRKKDLNDVKKMILSL